jgi:hypothetical protein
MHLSQTLLWLVVTAVSGMVAVPAPAQTSGGPPSSLFDTAKLFRPNASKYVEAKAAAEERVHRGEFDEALEQYETAWESANRAFANSEFGTRNVTYSLGGDRPLSIPFPKGAEIPDELARDAAKVAARADRPEVAITWVKRSTRRTFDRSRTARRMLAEFEADARERGVPRAADTYRLEVLRHDIAIGYPAVGRYRAHRETLGTILWTLEGLTILLALVLGAYEWWQRRERFTYYRRGQTVRSFRRGGTSTQGRKRWWLFAAVSTGLLFAGVWAFSEGAVWLHDAWGYFASGWGLAAGAVVAARVAIGERRGPRGDGAFFLGHGDDVPEQALERLASFDANAGELLRDLGAADWRGRVRLGGRGRKVVEGRFAEISGPCRRAFVAGWLGARLSSAGEAIPEFLDAWLRGFGERAHVWEPVCGEYLRAISPDRRAQILEHVPPEERLTLVPSDLVADPVVDEAVIAAWLQDAMLEGRRWERALWRHRFFDDPVMSNLVRGLVWGAFERDGALLTTLRVDGEGSLVDPEFETVALETMAADVRIGLVHAAELGEADCRRWAQHLADFEEISLFDQLERPVEVPDEGEWLSVEGRWSTDRRDRFVSELGWDEYASNLRKRYYGFGVTAVAPESRSPGPGVRSVRFVRGYDNYGGGLRLAELSKVLRSEILYRLTTGG